MVTQKVAISIDQHLLVELDNLVANKVFASRSEAIRIAVQEKIARMQRARLARECSKLDPAFERGLAEEGMAGELSQWPEY
jgi:metal-responsive CopG/Arc/MetJ family transcriptional regulator